VTAFLKPSEIASTAVSTSTTPAIPKAADSAEPLRSGIERRLNQAMANI
jgi:hypothetical protein